MKGHVAKVGRTARLSKPRAPSRNTEFASPASPLQKPKSVRKATPRNQVIPSPSAIRRVLTPKNLILYADKKLVVLNKPNGLASQPMSTDPERDDMAFAMKRVQDALFLEEELRTVHRLDKPTTGALLLARTPAAARDLSNQLQSGKLAKSYLALVCGGSPELPEKTGIMNTLLECKNGRVRVINDLEPNRSKEGTDTSTTGEDWVRKAQTTYEVVATSPKAPLSLLKLNLITGYKHQIRAQLAQHLGAPVLSDSLFGQYQKSENIVRMLKHDLVSCLYLHCSRLSFPRFRRTGPGKEFQFGVGAPLPRAWVALCEAAEIPLTADDVTGGVWVNGEKVRGVGAKPPALVPAEDSISADDARFHDVVEEELAGMWYGAGVR